MKSPLSLLLPFLLIIAGLTGCGSSVRVSGIINGGNGSFVFVANNNTNSISIFHQDKANGQLANMGSAATGACTGPRYVDMHPTSNFLFVTCQSSNTVAAFAVMPNSGALVAIGQPVASGVNPNNLSVDPKGRFLYVPNTGSNTVSAYSIGSDGSLSEIAGSPFATGLTPYTAKESDSGMFLYVTNRDSNNVSVYRIDQSTGGLTQIPGSLSQPTEVHGPLSCQENLLLLQTALPMT